MSIFSFRLSSALLSKIVSSEFERLLTLIFLYIEFKIKTLFDSLFEPEILMLDFFIEFYRFIVERKKYWLVPIFIILIVFGSIIVLSQGSALAPFIYTIW